MSAMIQVPAHQGRSAGCYPRPDDRDGPAVWITITTPEGYAMHARLSSDSAMKLGMALTNSASEISEREADWEAGV